MDSEAIEGGKNVDSNYDSSRPCASTSSTSCVNDRREDSSSQPAKPDGGWGWIVVIAAFIIQGTVDGLPQSLGNLLMDFEDYFKSNHYKTSWIFSVFLSMPQIAGPFASFLINRYGCRCICIIGAVLSTVFFISSTFVENVDVFCFTFAVTGFGLALCTSTATIIVTYYFEKKRSFAVGLATCGTGIGTLVFPPFINFLRESLGWKKTLLSLSGFFGIMVICGVVMRKLKSPTEEASVQEELQQGNFHSDGSNPEDFKRLRLCNSLENFSTDSRDNLSVGLSFVDNNESIRITIAEEKVHLRLRNLLMELFDFRIFLNSRFSLFCFTNFLTYISVDMPYVYIPDYAYSIGTNMDAATWLISVLGIFNCAGMAIVGFIDDKPWMNSFYLYSVCVMVSGISLVFMPLLPGYYTIMIIISIYGFTIAANFTLGSIIVSKLVPEDKFVSANGLLCLVQGLGGLIGPPLLGHIVDITGSYNVVFIISGVVIYVSGLIAFPVSETLSCQWMASSVKNKSKGSLPLYLNEEASDWVALLPDNCN